MNTPQLIPLIRFSISNSLPQEVCDEAEVLALNIASDDRAIYRSLNQYRLLDLLEDFKYYLDAELMLRHLISRDFESARNLVFDFLENRATENVAKRPEPTEEEILEDLRLADPKSWAWKDKGL